MREERFGPGRRAALLGVLLSALALWESFALHLPDVSDGWDVALVTLVLLPATFACALLVLPLGRSLAALPLGIAVAVLAAVLHLLGASGPFNVTKLLALSLVGLWFLRLFEALSWIVLVASIIPIVDTFSVYRGPTKVVIEEKPGLFDEISVAFALPGERASANLGPPDVFFFALFLGAAARFGLRVHATWIGMTALLSASLAAIYIFDLNGLPALPAIAVGFLVPNLDLLIASAREWRAGRGRS
jgi:hypothetical protein